MASSSDDRETLMNRSINPLLIAAAAVAMLVFASCGSDDSNAGKKDSTAQTAASTAVPVTIVADTTAAPETTAAAGAPQEYTVMTDGHVDSYNGAFIAYFPSKLSVHPGDTILYKSVFSGEPHSVAFGTKVDDLIKSFRALTPEQQSGDAPPPPDVEAKFNMIPPMIPNGPGDAVQPSVNPCFVPAGESIPTDPAQQCAVTEPDAFTGAETFYNSGFLPDGEVFALKLADDIAPGTYFGMCTLHSVEMVSEITVVPADEPIPSPDDVLAAGQQELEALAGSILPNIEQAKATGTQTHIQAGAGSETVHNAMAAEFILKDVHVKAGEPITWTFNGAHTVSFNAPEDARTILAKGDDGGFHLSEKALSPSGFTPPGGPPPSDGPPPPLDGGSWDGTGFFSTGIMFGGDFILTFTKPGTYEYVCLIHPNMEGTVTVE